MNLIKYKYATWDAETGELVIGAEMYGLASHGVGMCVGIWGSEAEASLEAQRRGCKLFNGENIKPKERNENATEA
jgi:hypothetical protein